MKRLNVKQKCVIKFVASILLIILLSLSYKTIRHYRYYMTGVTNLHNAMNQEKVEYKRISFARFMKMFKYVAKFEIQKKFSGNFLKDSELDTFYLSVKKSSLKKLNSDLPSSGKKYVSAFMKYNNNPEIFKIKLRYRGDMANHWMYEKKSFRVKMKRSANLDIGRQFNLVNLDTYKSTVDLVTYKIAKEEGIISPDFYPVRVFMNGDFYGIYFYLDQTKEQLLRKFNRMPGSIYQETGIDYNEDNSDDDLYDIVDEDGVGKVWLDELNWQKIAARNAEQKLNRDDIKFITNAVANYDDVEFYNFANRYLNKDVYYKYFAIDVLTGSPHHTYIHNHKLYFDPYTGQYEPIEWDVRYWENNDKSKDISNYQLLDRIKLNPVLEAERDKVTYQIIKKYTPKVLSDRYKAETNLFLKDLQSDKLRRASSYTSKLGYVYYSAYPIGEFKEFISKKEEDLQKRSAFLHDLYNKIDAKFNINENKITFEVGGNNPIIINKTDLLGSLGVKQLYPDTNLNGKFDEFNAIQSEEIVLYPGRIVKKGNVYDWDTEIGRRLFGNSHVKSHPQQYTFFFQGGSVSNPHSLKVKNFITNDTVIIDVDNISELGRKSDSIHPWKLPTKKTKIVIYSGLVNLNNTIEHNEEAQVIIRPGTKFIMNKDVSLVVYGKVLAQGTKNSPIVFTSKDSKNPWGAFIIQGKKASGSKFSNIIFKNGSLTYHNLISYTAPFNIHNLDDFEVDSCVIGANHVGDDAMHVAYSKGVIKNSKFIDARSDALDIDIANVKLINNDFINAGNDAIDSMTSNLIIENNRVRKAGDKCISVGERSSGTYTNNILDDCNIGIEAKDDSVITVEDTLISNSRESAIHIYRKNMYYNNAGTIYDKGISFKGNAIVDKKGFEGNYIIKR